MYSVSWVFREVLDIEYNINLKKGKECCSRNNCQDFYYMINMIIFIFERNQITYPVPCKPPKSLTSWQSCASPNQSQRCLLLLKAD
jgi:hypothetical protein